MNIDYEHPNAPKIPWMDELLEKLRAMGFYDSEISNTEARDATLIEKDMESTGDGVGGA